MSSFPESVSKYWHAEFGGSAASNRINALWAVSATLNAKRPAMILERADGSFRAVVHPVLAERFDVAHATVQSTEDMCAKLADMDLKFHDPDFVFYLPSGSNNRPTQNRAVRQLIDDDRTAFAVFQANASEQDREDSYVELDQWAVFGCFEGDQLVSAASALLWEKSPIADLGVLTLPNFRGKGCGRAVVRAISEHVRQQGYEPQYRCQIDNHASVALAETCGFKLFGKWTVAVDILTATVIENAPWRGTSSTKGI